MVTYIFATNVIRRDIITFSKDYIPIAVLTEIT